MDTHMADADPTAATGDEEQIELIAGDDVAREFELGDAPVDDEDDEDAMDDEDDDGKISAEDADVRDDAEMVFQKHSGPVYSISVNPVDSRLVLTGGGDDVGVIWNREDGSVLHTLSGHTDSVVSVDFSFDGKYAATGGYDGVVKIWEVATGKLVQTLEGPSQEVEWVTWHKKGNILLAGSGDGTVWMWLATTGECMHVFAGHEDSVTCGSFTGSGKVIVTGSTDGTVRVWNPKSGECIHVFRGHDFHEGPITFLTCHPSQPLMISGSQDGTAKLLQIQTKRVLATFSHDRNEATAGTVYEEQKTDNSTENSVECAGFSNTMQWAATGCLGGSVRIWDLSNYHCRHICRHPAGVIKLIWHPTVPIVYSCTVEGLIYVWDARSGHLIKTLAGHTDMVLDMAFVTPTPTAAPTGLLTASDDESIRLFAVTEQ